MSGKLKVHVFRCVELSERALSGYALLVNENGQLLVSARRCSRPGCSRPAQATLTFVYADSVAVVGPLAPGDEPHSWDMCEEHSSRITVPRGWEMIRLDSNGRRSSAAHSSGFDSFGVDRNGKAAPLSEKKDDDDLTALVDSVREITQNQAQRDKNYSRQSLGAEFISGETAGARHDYRGPSVGIASDSYLTADRSRLDRSGLDRPRPGRRGHLRLLPDPPAT